MSMVIRLTRPRRAAVIEYVVLATAGVAFLLSATWISCPDWMCVLAALVPFFIGYLDRQLQKSRHQPDFLWIHPNKIWKMGTFPDLSTQTLSVKAQSSQSIPDEEDQSVALIQYWQHFFCLTLSLKILNQPHNKPDVVRMTFWRCCIPRDIYRKMCVMVAWHVDQPRTVQDLETV